MYNCWVGVEPPRQMGVIGTMHLSPSLKIHKCPVLRLKLGRKTRECVVQWVGCPCWLSYLFPIELFIILFKHNYVFSFSSFLHHIIVHTCHHSSCPLMQGDCNTRESFRDSTWATPKFLMFKYKSIISLAHIMNCYFSKRLFYNYKFTSSLYLVWLDVF